MVISKKMKNNQYEEVKQLEPSQVTVGGPSGAAAVEKSLAESWNVKHKVTT